MIFQEGGNVTNITVGFSSVITGTNSNDHLVETEPELEVSPLNQLTRNVKRPMWMQDFILDKATNG